MGFLLVQLIVLAVRDLDILQMASVAPEVTTLRNHFPLAKRWDNKAAGGQFFNKGSDAANSWNFLINY